MEINVENLTPEEMDIIKRHRENQKKLILTHIKEENSYCKEYDEIQFSIKNDNVVHLSTKYQTNLEGKPHASSGFFNTDLTKEDAEKIRNFMNRFLQQTHINQQGV